MRRLLVALLLCGTVLVAQPQTPVASFPAFGSQVNVLESCLIMSASATAPGNLSSNFVGLLSLFSFSTTLSYTCDASITGVPPGQLFFFGAMEGAAGMPFILALSVLPGSLSCGGAAMTPCMTQGTLFNSLPTPYGFYHLDSSPIVLLNGFEPGAVAGILGPFGQTPLQGPVICNTAANGGFEQRFALQGLTMDPTAAAGLTFSAALNVDQWVSTP